MESNMQRPLVIRRAAIGDYEAVRALEELEFSVHREARPDCFRSLEHSYTEAEFEELLSCPLPISWVALLDETLVGLCFGKIEKTPENPVCKSRLVAFLQDIVTLPAYRGRGVATALLARARTQAISAGAASMELCVWDFNADALRLYKKAGMRVQYYRMEEALAGRDQPCTDPAPLSPPR